MNADRKNSKSQNADFQLKTMYIDILRADTKTLKSKQNAFGIMFNMNV